MHSTTRFALFATLLSTSFMMQCCEITGTLSDAISIRPATLADLNEINDLTHTTYHEHFKPIFSHMLPPQTDLEDFITKKISFQQNANKEFISEQLDQKNNRLIIAQETTSHAHPIIGYCRFNQKDPHNVHIYFLGINELFRRNGIGTQLIFAAINTFPEANNCTLRTLVPHNEAAHTFYKKLGFEYKGEVSLDLTTGQISTDPMTPTTHADYYLTIKK